MCEQSYDDIPALIDITDEERIQEYEPELRDFARRLDELNRFHRDHRVRPSPIVYYKFEHILQDVSDELLESPR